MRAFDVKTNISDYPFLVLADSFTEVEEKMKSQFDTITTDDIINIQLLEEWCVQDHIIL